VSVEDARERVELLQDAYTRAEWEWNSCPMMRTCTADRALSGKFADLVHAKRALKAAEADAARK
jgi:hypothetical protein